MFTSIGLLCINQTHLKLHFSPKEMACPNLCQLHQPVPHLPPGTFSRDFQSTPTPGGIWQQEGKGRVLAQQPPLAPQGFRVAHATSKTSSHQGNSFTPAPPPSQPQSQIPSIQAMKTGITEKKQTWKKNVQATSNIKKQQDKPKVHSLCWGLLEVGYRASGSTTALNPLLAPRWSHCKRQPCSLLNHPAHEDKLKIVCQGGAGWC